MKGYRMLLFIPMVISVLLLIFGLSQGCSKGSGGETSSPTDPSTATTASSGTGSTGGTGTSTGTTASSGTGSTGGTGTSTGTDSGTSSGGKSGGSSGSTWGFEVDPGSLNFGSHYASTGGVSLTFNVINTGSTEIDVSNDCGPYPPFSRGGGGGIIPAGGTVTYVVYFNIDTVGNFSGSCTVTGTSPAAGRAGIPTKTVALSGTVLVPKPPPPVKK